MEDFLRACHDAIKDDEPKSLAAKMGLPHVSLLQRANPDNDAHHLTIEHLYGVLLHTGDMRPLRALGDAFGFDLVARDKAEALTVQGSLNEVVAEFGDVARTVHDAMADNHLSALERRQIAKQAQELIDAVQGLIASAKQA
ncbi:phage regulatory CII family protein [Pseudomonas leptonychotis]|uniref:phage regulatory CII family protein n=1 Tax=Pseudomonas leptonychotis TaxID=2448482 RepID=UPI00386BFDB9